MIVTIDSFSFELSIFITWIMELWLFLLWLFYFFLSFLVKGQAAVNGQFASWVCLFRRIGRILVGKIMRIQNTVGILFFGTTFGILRILLDSSVFKKGWC
eukprot:TRINITY_DN13328_c1_g1_i3.p1 TRINITY_DN13328_c1_g1~~TRINITY_DN13328_c1_g1_i3.p1  ORF type:complete len:100 (+),score=9.11 TRINITY_DN13328_c1_g1_i3:414-713(+)